ncbi:MAG: ABC transporter ATP-binding protein [Candidatus Methylomirabilis oxygeniifera]|uniref:High-affinity branched-chain amino acid ABC transporter (ATP-binding protein) n=1 Tax=Methylomirabilis oxygeniifera TaxID=671143 RepID=D5MFC6_METO1|nr:MAG: ABC transporter ATP-binding protein [Candidatus Methylomirabilis oxyfera]CBE68455.1 high-affinity branched-chain amino acid ABC transporter (ATP-binding protein) [Candidatus Methylomirabilis oxyfera]
MLSLKEVHLHYGAIHALRGISLEVEQGQIVTLIGANGAGKSSTLMTISGILRLTSGRIIFEGEELTHLPAHTIVQRGISQVPEGRRIFPTLTVLENLEMGAYTRAKAAEVRHDLDRVFQLFPLLKDRRSQLGGTLSGGEQQMLAIGRALMARPRLLLLDEPSLGLAPKLVETIFEVIREINAQSTTILLVEQNAHMALRIAAKGYVMEVGQIVLADDAETLMANGEVRSAYLGE